MALHKACLRWAPVLQLALVFMQAQPAAAVNLMLTWRLMNLRREHTLQQMPLQQQQQPPPAQALVQQNLQAQV